MAKKDIEPEVIETVEEVIEDGLEIQSTFNEDGIDELLEEGEIVDVCEEN